LEPETKPPSCAQIALWSLALLGFLASVSGLSAPLKNKPINDQADEKHPGDTPAREERPWSPLLEANADQNDARQNGRKAHPYLKFGVNVLTLLAVVWYAWEARQQRVTMDNTFKQVQQQNNLMQQQVEGAMAAIITKQFRITWPKQAYLSVILDNRGRVIGSDIYAGFQVTEVSLPAGKDLGKALPKWEFSIPAIAPAPDLPLERGVYLNIPQEALKGIDGMPRALKLTGTFTYFNGFHNNLESVCYYVLGEADFTNEKGAVVQRVGPTVITCEALPAQVALYLQNQKDIGAQWTRLLPASPPRNGFAPPR
jgi:hypothetical protein